MKWLLDATEQYASHGKAVAKTGQNGASNLTSDQSLNKGLSHFGSLLERFANNQPMQPIFDAIQVLGDDARQDEGCRNWLNQVDEYTRRLLMEPGYVLQPDSDTRANQLKEDGRVYWNDKYKSHFDNVFNQVGKFFTAMGDVSDESIPTVDFDAHLSLRITSTIVWVKTLRDSLVISFSIPMAS